MTHKSRTTRTTRVRGTKKPAAAEPRAPVPRSEPAAAALEAERDELRAVLDAIPTPVLLVNRRGEVARTNAAVREQFQGAVAVGTRVGQLLGCPSALSEGGCGSGAPCEGCLVSRALEGTATNDLSTERECDVGGQKKLRRLRVSARPLRHNGEQCAVLSLQDITASREIEQERDRLQMDLSTAERVASLSMLAGGVAHEINNPLSYVLSNTSYAVEALRDRGAAQDPSRLAEVLTVLTEAIEGAHRVRRVVRDLKIFSRPESDRVRPTDVEEVLESALNLANNELRFRARLVLDFEGVPKVMANEVKLGQIFLALLLNASRAIPEGQQQANEIRVSTALDSGGRVRIEVRDTGVGIAPELVGRVFEPFFTSAGAPVATGLALSICRSLITQIGGEIHVESTPGHGSTFRVLLPVATPAADEPEGAADAPLFVRRGRVLVIDDEPSVGRALARALAPQHEVVVATSAAQARARLAEPPPFDVVLCDLMMPETSGMALYAELTRTNPYIAKRIIFITGGVFTTTAQEFLDHVPNLRLEKPFSLTDLRHALAHHLGPAR